LNDPSGISNTENRDMLFFSNKCGQLGNRLFSFAHLIAQAEHAGHKLINLAFEDYAQYFVTTRQDVLCGYPPSKNRLGFAPLRKLLLMINKGVVKILRKSKWLSSRWFVVVVADLPQYQFNESRYFDLNSEHFRQSAEKPLVFLFGRFFRDYKNFERHQDLIRKYFCPIPEIESMVNRTITRARMGSDLVVGVHIRRGDYQEFAGGKYFYSFQEYAQAMKQLQHSLPGKKLSYVICSNESIPLAEFSGLVVDAGPGHLVGDMYTLAACDYIMGPPSTYTLWASFYGRKPLYQFRGLSTPVTLDRFVILPPEILYNFSFN
jgi:hypothetical protein